MAIGKMALVARRSGAAPLHICVNGKFTLDKHNSHQNCTIYSVIIAQESQASIGSASTTVGNIRGVYAAPGVGTYLSMLACNHGLFARLIARVVVCLPRTEVSSISLLVAGLYGLSLLLRTESVSLLLVLSHCCSSTDSYCSITSLGNYAYSLLSLITSLVPITTPRPYNTKTISTLKTNYKGSLAI